MSQNRQAKTPWQRDTFDSGENLPAKKTNEHSGGGMLKTVFHQFTERLSDPTEISRGFSRRGLMQIAMPNY